jgi:aryl-alcohol dehydrogenase-like predicted oxidoreductase
VQHRSLPLLTSRPVPVVGTGAMPLSDGGSEPMDRDAAIAVLHHAFDAGLSLLE